MYPRVCRSGAAEKEYTRTLSRRCVSRGLQSQPYKSNTLRPRDSLRFIRERARTRSRRGTISSSDYDVRRNRYVREDETFSLKLDLYAGSRFAYLRGSDYKRQTLARAGSYPRVSHTRRRAYLNLL